MDGRSIVEGCIRHPSQHDPAAQTLEHDIALINDKVDKRNPYRSQMTNPVLIHRAFAWSWDLNPLLYFRIMVLQNLGRGTAKMLKNANSPQTAGKRASRKHRVSFLEAADSLSDRDGFQWLDSKHSQDESRFHWIGKSGAGRILTTRFTRRGKVIRIIGSASAEIQEALQ
jgi:uncharacterized DUF497 family protein